MAKNKATPNKGKKSVSKEVSKSKKAVKKASDKVSKEVVKKPAKSGPSKRKSGKRPVTKPQMASRLVKGSEMSRKGFLKTAGLAAAGVGAVAMGLGGAAKAHWPHVLPINPDPGNIIGKKDADGNPVDRAAVNGDSEIWVYGTRDVSKDPVNVQWAVGQYFDAHPDDPSTPEDEYLPPIICGVKEGGTVKLIGTFHFSSADSNDEINFEPFQVHLPYFMEFDQFGSPLFKPVYLDEKGRRMFYVDEYPGSPNKVYRYAYPFGDVEAEPPEPPHWEMDPEEVYPLMFPGANDKSVSIFQSVTIIGDKAGDQYNTKIIGGYETFSVGSYPRWGGFVFSAGYPNGFQPVFYDFFWDVFAQDISGSVRWVRTDPDDPTIGFIDPAKKLDVTIQDIQFEQACAYCILAVSSTSLNIVGNYFGKMRGFDLANYVFIRDPEMPAPLTMPWDVSFAGSPHHPVAYPIMIPSSGQYGTPLISKDLHSGPIIVSDNVIDGGIEEVDVIEATPQFDENGVEVSTPPAGHWKQLVIRDFNPFVLDENGDVVIIQDGEYAGNPLPNEHYLETELYNVPFRANAQTRVYLLGQPPAQPPDYSVNDFTNSDTGVVGWAGSSLGIRTNLMNADLLITRNTIINVPSLGVTQEGNYGKTLITDNYVEIANIPEMAEGFSSDIWITDSSISYQRWYSQTILSGNVLKSHHPMSDMVVLEDLANAVIQKNDIQMLGPQVFREGIAAINCKNCFFGQNKISGSGINAVAMIGLGTLYSPYEFLVSSGNEFTATNLAHADVGTTYYLHWWAINNTIRGSTGGAKGTVSDKPEPDPECGDALIDGKPAYYVSYSPDCQMELKNNKVTGLTPMSGATNSGKKILSAVHQRNDMMARWRDTVKWLKKNYGNLKPPR